MAFDQLRQEKTRYNSSAGVTNIANYKELKLVGESHSKQLFKLRPGALFRDYFLSGSRIYLYAAIRVTGISREQDIIIIDQLRIQAGGNELIHLQCQQGGPVNFYILRIMQVVGKEVQPGGPGNVGHDLLIELGGNESAQLVFEFLPGLQERSCAIRVVLVFGAVHPKGTQVGQPLIRHYYEAG